ncbi:transcription factor SCREAM2-like [Raphanus sativus]|nr:transcription factor SCREAM2-like [Raphanus sativus]
MTSVFDSPLFFRTTPDSKLNEFPCYDFFTTDPPPSRSCTSFSPLELEGVLENRAKVLKPLEVLLPLVLSRRCSRNELHCVRVRAAKCATLHSSSSEIRRSYEREFVDETSLG